jgi:hypothetical protein
VQFVERRHLHTATGYGTSTVAIKITKAAVHKWYHNTPNEWFCEAMWKLPVR